MAQPYCGMVIPFPHLRRTISLYKHASCLVYPGGTVLPRAWASRAAERNRTEQRESESGRKTAPSHHHHHPHTSNLQQFPPHSPTVIPSGYLPPFSAPFNLFSRARSCCTAVQVSIRSRQPLRCPSPPTQLRPRPTFPGAHAAFPSGTLFGAGPTGPGSAGVVDPGAVRNKKTPVCVRACVCPTCWCCDPIATLPPVNGTVRSVPCSPRHVHRRPSHRQITIGQEKLCSLEREEEVCFVIRRPLTHPSLP